MTRVQTILNTRTEYNTTLTMKKKIPKDQFNPQMKFYKKISKSYRKNVTVFMRDVLSLVKRMK